MKTKKIEYKHYILLIILCFLMFSASAAIAATHHIGSSEKSVFNFFYGWGNGLKPFFLPITELGSIWFMLTAIGVFYWQKKKNLSIKLLLGGLLTYGLVEIAKILVDRPRPYVLLSNVMRRDSFVSGTGFPSGHTAIFTFFCIIIQPYLHKKIRWLTWPVIIMVGISRIYLGVHAPLDVLGGFALGGGIAYSIRYLLQRRFANHSG